uniref:hypothetical protein n=1 Tax=Methylobacterium sp. B34 TaxID=95563 RepID=UPI00034D9F9A|nr:hypothetical protein [Methylobacterium sp. B34]
MNLENYKANLPKFLAELNAEYHDILDGVDAMRETPDDVLKSKGPTREVELRNLIDKASELLQACRKAAALHVRIIENNWGYVVRCPGVFNGDHVAEDVDAWLRNTFGLVWIADPSTKRIAFTSQEAVDLYNAKWAWRQ